MTSERKFIEENVKRVLLKEYLRRKTERSGFGGLDIQRTPMGTRVTLIAERPGMVIGRKGETIKELTDYVQNEFNFDNPQIEVKEVSNPNLNPHIMAQKLANALERGWHFRRAGHSTVRRIMSAGAKGCQVIISGKLTGQRHRTEKFREGHIKYCGETKLQWMHEGYAVAKKKLGVIGVKVQIMDPKAKLPDEIEFHELREVAEIKTEPEVLKGDEAEVKAETETETVVKAEGEIKADEVEVSAEVEVDAEVKATEKKKEKVKETKKRATKKKDKDTEVETKEPEQPPEQEIVTKEESQEPEEIEQEKPPETEPEVEPETKPEENTPEADNEPEASEELAEAETEKEPESEEKPEVEPETEEKPEENTQKAEPEDKEESEEPAKDVEVQETDSENNEDIKD
jgi:small subunit ribosomal protein S3